MATGVTLGIEPTVAKRYALIASIVGGGIVFLDGTVVNVALPAIRAGLHGDLADQQWVVEAYLLTLSSLLLVGGSLGDLLGRRRIFAAGLVGFGACSLLCAVSVSTEMLICTRAVQGVAGALLVPSSLALIMDNYDSDERGAAIGTWAACDGHCNGDRPARRRLPDPGGLVALDLRDQPRARRGDPLVAAPRRSEPADRSADRCGRCRPGGLRVGRRRCSR